MHLGSWNSKEGLQESSASGEPSDDSGFPQLRVKQAL